MIIPCLKITQNDFQNDSTQKVQKVKQENNFFNSSTKIRCVKNKTNEDNKYTQKVHINNQAKNINKNKLIDSKYSRFTQMTKIKRDNKQMEFRITSSLKKKDFAQQLCKIKRSINFRRPFSSMPYLTKNKYTSPMKSKLNPQIDTIQFMSPVLTENIVSNNRIKTITSEDKFQFNSLNTTIHRETITREATAQSNKITKREEEKFNVKKRIQSAYSKIIFQSPQKSSKMIKPTLNQFISTNKKYIQKYLRETKIPQIQMLKNSKLAILQQQKQFISSRLSQSLKNMKFKRQLKEKNYQQRRDFLAYKHMFIKNQIKAQKSLTTVHSQKNMLNSLKNKMQS